MADCARKGEAEFVIGHWSFLICHCLRSTLWGCGSALPQCSMAVLFDLSACRADFLQGAFPIPGMQIYGPNSFTENRGREAQRQGIQGRFFDTVIRGQADNRNAFDSSLPQQGLEVRRLLLSVHRILYCEAGIAVLAPCSFAQNLAVHFESRRRLGSPGFSDAVDRPHAPELLEMRSYLGMPVLRVDQERACSPGAIGFAIGHVNYLLALAYVEAALWVGEVVLDVDHNESGANVVGNHIRGRSSTGLKLTWLRSSWPTPSLCAPSRRQQGV